MNYEDILQNSGMTSAESKVYLTLIKQGQSRAGHIIKHTGLQSSVVHNALNTLQEKGFISYILIGKIKEYQSLDPKIITEQLENKKKEMAAIIPELEKLRKPENTATAEIFEGYKGILNAMLIMTSDAKQGEVFKYFAAPAEFLDEESIKFFEKADRVRTEKGVILKGIAEKKNKKLRSYKASEIRYTTQEIPSAMNIFKDNILIISLESKPTAVLIKSAEISRQYHKLWDAIWKES